MPALRYFVVDAFTDRPFSGNPAAVVPLTEWKDDGWLQSVAMEMNLSETAFLVPEGDGYRLRWFTPRVEVALCGHATLTSAHVLWSEGYAAVDRKIEFHTKSGLLKAAKNKAKIELDFPTAPSSPARRRRDCWNRWACRQNTPAAISSTILLKWSPKRLFAAWHRNSSDLLGSTFAE